MTKNFFIKYALLQNQDYNKCIKKLHNKKRNKSCTKFYETIWYYCILYYQKITKKNFSEVEYSKDYDFKKIYVKIEIFKNLKNTISTATNLINKNYSNHKI